MKSRAIENYMKHAKTTMNQSRNDLNHENSHSIYGNWFNQFPERKEAKVENYHLWRDEDMSRKDSEVSFKQGT